MMSHDRMLDLTVRWRWTAKYLFIYTLDGVKWIQLSLIDISDHRWRYETEEMK